MRVFPALPLVFVVTATPLLASFASEPHNQAEFDAAHLSKKADFDRLGHARDNDLARLYWFTDLKAAKTQAKREHKPILSLRMLGKLTDEYSCANSRFFRVALYPNARISQLLREKFVLHWSSERPVPVVTIDFGDGRQIKRTLTGNSAHYLLDSDGKPLDVLPSLYAPGAFARWLQESAQLAQDVAAKPAAERAAFLAAYHRAQIEATTKAYNVVNRANPGSDSVVFTPTLAGMDDGLSALNYLPLRLNADEIVQQNPLESPQPLTAEVAESLTVTKMRAEMPVLNAMRLYSLPPLMSATEDDMWARLGQRYREEARLDANCRRLFATKLAPVPSAGIPNQGVQLLVNARQTPLSTDQSKSDVAESTLESFEASMAKETAFNELRLHLPIHALFADAQQGDFVSLNRKIYDRLFLTPQNDAWMGLRQDTAFTALENGGVVSR